MQVLPRKIFGPGPAAGRWILTGTLTGSYGKPGLLPCANGPSRLGNGEAHGIVRVASCKIGNPARRCYTRGAAIGGGEGVKILREKLGLTQDELDELLERAFTAVDGLWFLGVEEG